MLYRYCIDDSYALEGSDLTEWSRWITHFESLLSRRQSIRKPDFLVRILLPCLGNLRGDRDVELLVTLRTVILIFVHFCLPGFKPFDGWYAHRMVKGRSWCPTSRRRFRKGNWLHQSVEKENHRVSKGENPLKLVVAKNNGIIVPILLPLTNNLPYINMVLFLTYGILLISIGANLYPARIKRQEDRIEDDR